MRRLAGVVIVILALASETGAVPSLAAQSTGEAAGFAPWPRTVSAQGVTATIYQPQVEFWNGNTLKVRSALSATFAGVQETEYGVLSLTAHTQVDKEGRAVRLTDVENLSVSLPGAPSREGAFMAALRPGMLQDLRDISLDRLESALAVHEAEVAGLSSPLDNTPPQIIISKRPALLIYIDGEPRLAPVPGTGLQRVVNTRVLLIKASDGAYYLRFMNGYLSAPALLGPWSIADRAPQGADAALEAAKKSRQVDLLAGQPDPQTGQTPSLFKLPGPPDVYVAARPSELIVMNGEPIYAPIRGTSLEYVKNTTAGLFKDTRTGKVYALLSGRWFSAPSLGGPWAYVPPKNLPRDFARIPDDSPKENVKASVPGTEQANEAVISAGIPQTAVVDRQHTTFTQVIDGPVHLRPIAGTSLYYVFNAADPIIKVSDFHWYALHGAVWFTASDVTGPWSVATEVPAAIYAIPVTSPLHYVVYVKIYAVTPATVVEGYTSGYYGTLITPDGVVVYGTGYTYPAWVSGTVWYGPPVTYCDGASMCWTPWGGWAFGFAFGWAWWDDDCDGCWCYPPAPWWGPYYSGAYYNGYGGVTAWGPNGWAGTTGNIYRNWGSVSSVSRGIGGYDAVTGNEFAKTYGMAYNSRTGAIAAGGRGAVDNVYTGNYAYGGHAAGVNPNTGSMGSAGRVTVGNADTGRSVTAGRVDAHTGGGQSVDIGGLRGSGGDAIGHINNNVFASRDGQLYRYNSDTRQWDPLRKPGQPGAPPGGQNQEDRLQNLRDRLSRNPNLNQDQLGNLRERALQKPGLTQDRSRELDRERAQRDMGALRENSFHSFGGGRPMFMPHFGGFRR